jgi:DNA-binding response OmpR family regulator
MPHVVLVEDDALIRKLLEHRLALAGWKVTPLRDARGLAATVREHATDLVLLDLGLPHGDGFAAVEELRAQGLQTPVLVLTAYDLPHLASTAKAMGADDLMHKPCDHEELVARMHRMLAA